MVKIKKILFACSLIVIFLCLFSIPVSADTDGTELNILVPSKLEIQLGTEWSGVQFQLKTDIGLYPDKIPVGEDGVLRLEIGGSSTYILTCLNSDVAAPNPDRVDNDTAPETSDKEKWTMAEIEAGEDSATEEAGEEEADAKGNTDTVAGIPITHLLLFCGGLLMSVGTLIAIRVISSKKRELYEYDDDEEDE